jgi:acetate---CoA ligase (ADP-forming)
VSSAGTSDAMLDALFRPSSVAVIGASKATSADGSPKLGAAAITYLVEHGFPGAIYPVNPKEADILGHRCHASIREVPGPVDLAVLVLPAEACVAAMRECGEKGVRAAIVMSSGFGEAGNRQLEDELKSAARAAGVRFIGPNTAGFVSVPAKLVASISMVCAMRPFRPGGVAFITQSGAMGGSMLGRGMEEGVGFSHWVTTGNEADLDTADYLDHLADDPDARVFALFLEGVRDAPKFLRACAKAARFRKPIIVYKSGASEVGARASVSHTGAIAGSHAVFSAICRQHGLIRVDDVADLLPIARTFAWVGERLDFAAVAGNRVGLISASGGICGVAADECERHGLTVPELSGAVQEEIRGYVPSFASVRNPVDVTGQIRASATGYQSTVRAVLRQETIDTVLLLVTMAAEPRASFYGREIGALVRQADKPVLVTWAGPVSLAEKGLNMLQEAHVPVFASASGAVKALQALVDYGAFLRRLGTDESRAA